MHERTADLEHLAQALVHWLDAHGHTGDPTDRLRALASFGESVRLGINIAHPPRKSGVFTSLFRRLPASN